MHREEYMAMHCRQHQIRGHEAIVKLLLEKGADVNAQGGLYGNALQAASVQRS
jgi:ankyrin repeat protein